IQQYVALRKRGRNYIGLCPFHSEKSPSFTVSPDKKIFHCFGCHASGDLISFVQKYDNATFIEAIETIAEFANIPITKKQSSQSFQELGPSKKVIAELLSFVNTHYKAFLQQNDSDSLTYLLERGMSAESIENFGLGYSARQLKLFQVLKDQGYKEAEIKKSGLFAFADHSTYERFSQRITFPIHDYQDRIVGFGGRVLLAKDKMAKYVNSEESNYFNKRKLLYGLSKAKKYISNLGFVLVMEGYIDVIMAHQFGFSNAVACMGTALTEDQIKTIQRLTNKIYLVMDSDEAGKRSTERSYVLCKQCDCQVYVVKLDEKDPADVLTTQGGEYFQEKITNAKPGFLAFFDDLLAEKPQDSIEQVTDIVDLAIEKLNLESDPIIHQHYAQEIALKLKIDPNLIMAKLNKKQYTVPNFSRKIKQEQKTKYEKAEESLLALIATSLEARQIGGEKIIIDYFSNEVNKELYQFIVKATTINNELTQTITNGEKRDKLVSYIVANEDFFRKNQVVNMLNEYINVLKNYYNDKKRSEIKEKIKKYEKEGNDAEVERLLSEL
ncbi:DNA primase, partial [Candidatus Marinamargulisbacteria bacterium SCGC AG-414-C22]